MMAPVEHCLVNLAVDRSGVFAQFEVLLGQSSAPTLQFSVFFARLRGFAL